MGNRLPEVYGIIPLWESKDWTAGADADSFTMATGALADIILNFGVLTVPGAISLFSGVTAAAKTTALPFTYRLSTADYAAAGADLFGADVAVANGVLTLSATAHDHRVIVISFAAADLPVDHKWVTAAVAAGTAQVLSAVAIIRGVRYQPPITAI